ncbi:MAG: thermonuclease family protein [Candidatus Gygaella obscura]|nr:thermonuclease family protein [Candidatus Gygaella obscura]
MIKKFRLLPLIVFIAVFFICGCSSGNLGNDFYIVKKVIDGDTVVLSNGQTLRYIGIDTPETSKKVSGTWQYSPKDFAVQAKEFNRRLVDGKKVRIEFDVQKKDKYARLLGYCFVDDVFVNEKLLDEGFAVIFTYPPNIKYVDHFIDAQQKARGLKKGIWQEKNVIPATIAKKFIGSIKNVEGRFSGLIEKPNLFMIFFDDESRKKALRLVIFRKDIVNFERAGIDIFEHFTNRVIRVSGLITEYKGSAQIIVRHPIQIQIID